MWIAVKEILKLCPAETLVTLYKIPTFNSVDDFLSKVATVRGKLKKGGVLDTDAAARIVLHDWNEGSSKQKLLIVLHRGANEPTGSRATRDRLEKKLETSRALTSPTRA
ncbi:putative GTP-binding protein, orthogonal bundle domain superfamily [Helianthus annuus]|nr:putative GTP-binding protein, orthogonal bundle domain superfamily [Helianthus annuus]